MLRNLLAAVGTALLATASTASAQENFKPQLDKVTVNGQTLYQHDSVEIRTVDVDSTQPAKIEFTFVNTGTAPSDKPVTVFVHFMDERFGKILLNQDYDPSTPSTSWSKGTSIIDGKMVDFSTLRDKTVEVYLGLFIDIDRFDLANEGFLDDKRLFVGKLRIK